MRLDRIIFFLSLLQNPHQKLKFIHVGGTAGKGSVSFITASILEEAGYKVGLAISPHLQKITERIQINRHPIPEKSFVSYINRLKPIIEKVKLNGQWGYPSYFEILIVLSFLYFAEEKVDLAVVEVGLGGTLDGTNVIKSEVSIVTNIGFDHMDWLGNSLIEIAGEKAGIIKPCSVVITGATQQSVLQLLAKKAADQKVKLLVLGRDFKLKKRLDSFDYRFRDYKPEGLKISMKGDFQLTNAVLAITAVRCMPEFYVSDDTIRKALLNLNFPGRLEIIKVYDKTLVIDGAHNPMKIKALVASLKTIFPGRKFPIVISIKKDKDYRKMLKLLAPIGSEYIVTEFGKITDTGIKLARMAPEIAGYILKISPGAKVKTAENAKEVFKAIPKIADSHILITGSLYLVGEIRELLNLKWTTKIVCEREMREFKNRKEKEETSA